MASIQRKAIGDVAGRCSMAVFAWICFVLSLIFCADAHAQLTRLNVASSGIGPVTIPPYFAYETGIYSKNGLDVSVIRTRPEIAVMSLFAGDTPVIQVAGATVIRSNLINSEYVFIAAGAVSFDYWLMTGKAIKTAQDLKGRTVGVASLRGSTMLATRYLLGKIGLNLERDVTIVQIGAVPDRLIALRTGRIDATLLNPPTSLAAQKEGFNVLTIASLPVQNNGPVTTRKYIKERPDILRKYVKAHVEAIHMMKTNREAWIKVLGKYVKVDRDVLEKSYDVSVTDELFPRKQYPSTASIQAALAEMSEEEPRARNLKAENFVDPTFITELDKSGYIDNLYRRN